ncbi:MAG TPA: hypothetical protein VGD22_10820 [Sphingobacteriaceae bacterium]
MIYRQLTLLFIFAILQISAFSQKLAKPSELRTDLVEFTDRVWKNGYSTSLTPEEYLQDTSGYQVVRIESRFPAFSWILNDDKKDILQNSYQILVSSNRENIQSDRGDMWDSRNVASSNSHSVLYRGKTLKPHKVYYWKVRMKTSDGDLSVYSDPKAFITGSCSENYTTPYYPLQKTRQVASKISLPSPGYYLADFGKDAFGQLEIRLDSRNRADTVTVELGEALNLSGFINSKPVVLLDMLNIK